MTSPATRYGPVIAEAHGIVAKYSRRDPDGIVEWNCPVVAWDADGYALIAAPYDTTGQLRRCDECLNEGWKFDGLTIPGVCYNRTANSAAPTIGKLVVLK